MIRRIFLSFALILPFCAVPTFNAGCQNLAAVPLFNADAPLKNRIASGRELDAELNNGLADARDMGLITQDAINQRWAPQLDAARRMLDESDAALAAGDAVGAASKLNMGKTILMALKANLDSMKKGAH